MTKFCEDEITSRLKAVNGSGEGLGDNLTFANFVLQCLSNTKQFKPRDCHHGSD